MLSRGEIAALIESADFSLTIEAPVVKRVDGHLRKVREKRTYQRRHLNYALLKFWHASSQPCGRADRIFFFASVENYSKEAGKCERQTRYDLRKFENSLGVLTLHEKANSVRRPTTYRFNPHALRVRPTPIRSKHSRPLHSASATEAIGKPITPPPEPMPVPTPTSSPTGWAGYDSCRTTDRKRKELTSREGRELVAKLLELQKGHTRHTELDGYSFDLEPDDHRYRAPLSKEDALRVACLTLQFRLEPAKEYAEQCGWKFDEPEKGQGP